MKKAFTIIEMMVVMAIFAILSLISVSALMSARDYNTADAAAEKLLMTVREAQNNSLSVLNGKNSRTKVWGVHLGNGLTTNLSYHFVKLISFSLNSSDSTKLDYNLERTIENNNEIKYKIVINGIENSTNIGNTFITFSSPFASTNIYGNSNTLYIASTPSDSGCAKPNNGVWMGCRWQESTKPTQEWELYQGNTTLNPIINKNTNPSTEFKIKITYKNFIKYVVVKSNGDSYIE